MSIKSTSALLREDAIRMALEKSDYVTRAQVKNMTNEELGDLLDGFFTFDNFLVYDTKEEVENFNK